MRNSQQQKLTRVIVYSVLLMMALFYLTPLYVMVSTSFKTNDAIRAGGLLLPPTHFTFDAWATAWGSACIGAECNGLKGYFLNSLKMAIPAVLISTFLGSVNGYILTQWRFRGSEWVFRAMLLGCFIPFQAILLPMAQTLSIVGIESGTVRLIFVHVVYGIGFTTLFFRNYYMSIPEDLIKAARIDGAGFFRIFWSILMPISLPIAMVCVIWQFTQIWNDFLFGVVFAESPPVTVGLNNLVNTSTGVKEYNVDMAGAMIAALPTLFVYAVTGKYFVRGLTAGAVKG